MSKKALAWGCGIAAAVVVTVVVAIVLGLAYMAQDVKGVGVSVDGPEEVVVGQTFQLSVSVTNERPRKVLSLADIDLAEVYLAGFSVSAIEPRPKSSMHVPLDNSRSFHFGVELPPGASKVFTFTLRAEKSGVYRGDLDVCEGSRFITTMAQTSVKER